MRLNLKCRKVRTIKNSIFLLSSPNLTIQEHCSVRVSSLMSCLGSCLSSQTSISGDVDLLICDLLLGFVYERQHPQIIALLTTNGFLATPIAVANVYL